MRFLQPRSGLGGSCGDTSCGPGSRHTSLGTALALSPFVVTFVVVAIVVDKRIFPQLSRVQNSQDGEDHYLPPSAPPTLQQAHAEHGRRSLRRRVAAVTFSVTVALATVLAELILAEISELVNPHARAVGLRFTVPTLLFLLIVLIPFLELQSIIAGWGWKFQRTAKGRIPRMAWLLQLAAFGTWLFAFWSVGRAVPVADERDYLYTHHGGASESFDSTAMTIGRASARKETLGDTLEEGGLARACLERIGVVGISLMALLSGFASVSSPWHALTDSKAHKRRPITDADIARKESGLEATSELLLTKRHRLRSLQRKMAAMADGASGAQGGLVGSIIGSLKTMGGSSDAAEIKTLQLEISGLETMEASLSSSLGLMRTRQAIHARDGTVTGRLLAIPSYAFSLYCVYRIMATSLTSVRRMYYPSATFSSSDPINRCLGLLAKHWDPKLDQLAWARQISFLLSGVILAASANSVLQTFHIFAKWAPGLLYQAQANLALLIGQIAATYVISAALLLRSNLPKEVGSHIADALESALEPGFVDRWFEGWFLVASIGTALGIWIGWKLGVGGLGDLDDWDEYGAEEMGQKRS